jgi:hypothetical protein
MLLLVDFSADGDAGVDIPSSVAETLLTGVTLCVRDVDFIGWYRTHRVMGAVLTQGVDAPAFDSANDVRQRVAADLTGRLPVGIGDRLRVRVLHPLRAELS